MNNERHFKESPYNPDYRSGGGGGGNRPKQTFIDPKQEWSESNFKKEWITKEIDFQFTKFAERLGKYMANNGLTSSKIRSIYGEMKRIQMAGYEKEKASFFLLRPKVAYAFGRDKNIRGLELFKIMFDECSTSVTDERTFLNFCNVFEAVLAYHKAYVKKDN